ncbi:hypothetical protein NEDG_01607 [Nematocida displodere]|uniref:Uncharacterized protein n=1 Tax=Nematocida displodere TaxID=1805483 RepID=A0A177EGU7_9MICR|nr:hypothetical protein NEDG_01607 [Nematocida displodere]
MEQTNPAQQTYEKQLKQFADKCLDQQSTKLSRSPSRNTPSKREGMGPPPVTHDELTKITELVLDKNIAYIAEHILKIHDKNFDNVMVIITTMDTKTTWDSALRLKEIITELGGDIRKYQKHRTDSDIDILDLKETYSQLLQTQIDLAIFNHLKNNDQTLIKRVSASNQSTVKAALDKHLNTHIEMLNKTQKEIRNHLRSTYKIYTTSNSLSGSTHNLSDFGSGLFLGNESPLKIDLEDDIDLLFDDEQALTTLRPDPQDSIKTIVPNQETASPAPSRPASPVVLPPTPAPAPSRSASLVVLPPTPAPAPARPASLVVLPPTPSPSPTPAPSPAPSPSPSPSPSRPASTHSSRRSSVDLIHTQPGLLYALACDLLLYLVAITVLLPILLFALHTGSSLSPSTLSQTFPYFGQCTDAIQNLTDKNIFTGLSISAVLAVLATLILSDEYTPIHPKITPRYLSTKSAAKKAGAIGILAAGIFLFITMGIVMVSDVLVVASDLKLSQMEMFLTVVTGASFAVFLVHRAVTAFKNATSQRPSVERVVHLSVFVLTTMLCLFMITACVAKFNSEAVTVFPAVKQAACDLFTFEEDPPTLWYVASSWGGGVLNPFNGSAAE